MTRIYTNVPAMIARANLGKNMSALQTSLERLSTGFKINSGKDDPAGLIASEMLRSDITGIKVAIKNTERANMMIATADSALNEVTNLLNDIRGLVTEAANTGAMSAEMIYANQLQVDASLDAIDRIASQTTFMGQKLLDGSLDFNYVGIDRNSVKGLAVHQVTFGADRAPTDVTINVRAAAEKAALYYNQPALAEAIILTWGGAYGYDMETFEKGATVADIAEIINKRADGTGVVAEVGSDALKGLLYVSSLGPDNDIIIEAGLAGLNGGNVQIKYLEGTSDGIQIMYQEPIAAGAPATILVYLQTEAYQAAFADDIDTTWTMINGQLVPMRDNNALKFEANIEGAQYNNANIFYVDGSLTDPRFYADILNSTNGTNHNPNGTAGMPYAYYSESGQSSTALFGNVPGAASGGVNGTSVAFDLAANEYFSIQSRVASSEYNNVEIQFVAASHDSPSLGNRAAVARFDEILNERGEVTNKILTVFYNNDGNTTLRDVQDALNILGNNTGHGFDVRPQIGAKTLNDVRLTATPAGRTVSSNTHNSGGVAGSLFIVVPPDGIIPPRANVQEQASVTTRAVGDGLYLAHKSPAWENYFLTFESTTNPGVDIVFDSLTSTVVVRANAQASYEDILDALNNGPWVGGKPPALIGEDLYWADVNGDPKNPGVPRSLSPKVETGVVGRSNFALTTIGTQELYLHHSDAAMSGFMIEFIPREPSGGSHQVTATESGGRVTVVYDNLATYQDIIDELNRWADTRGGSLTSFSWVNADGSSFNFGPTGTRATSTEVATGITLQGTYGNEDWNNIYIEFGDTGDLAVTAVYSPGPPGNGTIAVGFDSASSHSYDDILAAINNATGVPAGMNLTGLTWDGVPNTAAPFMHDGVTVTLNGATPGGAGPDVPPSGTLRTIDTGSLTVRTDVPVGEHYYLSHTSDPSPPAPLGTSRWDALSLNFSKTGNTGGSVIVTFDGTNVNVLLDDDATYDAILNALNNPFGDLTTGTPAWRLTGPAAAVPGGSSLIPVSSLSWVNADGTLAYPHAPTALVSETIGFRTYHPYTYSPDGRSGHVGNGLYLHHSNTYWDNIDIVFADTGTPAPSSGGIHSVTFDGERITIALGSNATYDDILRALNNPEGVQDPAGPSYPGAPDPSDPDDWLSMPWRLIGSAAATPLSSLPSNDWRWVDVNGASSTVTTPVGGGSWGHTGDVPDPEDLTFAHLDPAWDGFTIRFAEFPSSENPANLDSLRVTQTGHTEITVYFHAGATDPPTYRDAIAALNAQWSGKPLGLGELWIPADADDAADDAIEVGSLTLGTVTYMTYLTPNPPLNTTVSSGAVERQLTANDIAAIFDLDSYMSRGSERAASLFTVSTTVDNDGTGPIRLYDYAIDRDGNIVGWMNASGQWQRAPGPHGVDLSIVQEQPAFYAYIHTKTAFEKAFDGGVSGGDVITTAAELVTALNNSAFWGGVMCPEMIAELAKENAEGKYYDLSDPPVITARLAPNNNGYFAVSTFQEVAYYGDPNDGTALQFLGGMNSPNIRFVAGPPNSELSIDRTTVPAIVGQAQAVLTAQDSGASLTITSNKRGEEYDDVQFVFKRVGEDADGRLAPDRRDGWVEYDPGTSFAYAQATFLDAGTGQSIPNSAFFITSTERGDLYNNVDVMMRLDDSHSHPDPVSVSFDLATGQLRISIDSARVHQVTTNDIIAAINNASVPFEAELSYSESPLNDGSGTFDHIGLSSSRFTNIANTGETGGRKGGTVTVWLAAENLGPGAPNSPDAYQHPTQEDIVRLINADPVVGNLFTARAYNTVQGSDGKVIDFVKDGPIVTSGGLIQPALITVHLATDAVGNITTTAADLTNWWNDLDPALVDNISVSIVRPAGAVWDDCSDPYGYGLLHPTVARGDCEEWIINDIMFVGWNDNVEKQHYVARHSTGVMTSQRGIDASYQLIARNLGPEWDGYTIEYIHDNSVTGRFADNLVSGSAENPCDDDPYFGLPRDDCGNLITPNSTTENGLQLIFDPDSKKITIHVNFGRTTANDIQELINSDPRTRNLFQVVQLGNGTGFISPDDDTLITTGGAAPPGELNGAKLLFGSDATDYFLIFRSTDYGSNQFVHVYAQSVEPEGYTTFAVTDESGNQAERANGKDVEAIINGVRASGTGLGVSLNTSSLSMTFTFSEYAGTMAGFSTGFTIAGGGATFQVGPDVVSRQQISMGIRSINTVMLGGPSGVLNQLRSGHDAALDESKGGSTSKAFRIVQESLLAITSIRGRLGTMQRATLETNINVLNDTLSSLMEAESQIRDTDFAEETSNLTRAQILVQANMNTLGIANQIPNYMLSLLGR